MESLTKLQKKKNREKARNFFVKMNGDYDYWYKNKRQDSKMTKTMKEYEKLQFCQNRGEKSSKNAILTQLAKITKYNN